MGKNCVRICFYQSTHKIVFTLYADMKESYVEYNAQYKETVDKYANATTMLPQTNLPPNIFAVSCLPWLHFDHFSSDTKVIETPITKMIALGKYKELNEKLICPFTIQVSHTIADGYHVSLFFEQL